MMSTSNFIFFCFVCFVVDGWQLPKHRSIQSLRCIAASLCYINMDTSLSREKVYGCRHLQEQVLVMMVVGLFTSYEIMELCFRTILF